MKLTNSAGGIASAAAVVADRDVGRAAGRRTAPPPAAIHRGCRADNCRPADQYERRAPGGRARRPRTTMSALQCLEPRHSGADRLVLSTMTAFISDRPTVPLMSSSGSDRVRAEVVDGQRVVDDVRAVDGVRCDLARSDGAWRDLSRRDGVRRDLAGADGAGAVAAFTIAWRSLTWAWRLARPAFFGVADDVDEDLGRRTGVAEGVVRDLDPTGIAAARRHLHGDRVRDDVAGLEVEVRRRRGPGSVGRADRHEPVRTRVHGGDVEHHTRSHRRARPPRRRWRWRCCR